MIWLARRARHPRWALVWLALFRMTRCTASVTPSTRSVLTKAVAVALWAISTTSALAVVVALAILMARLIVKLRILSVSLASWLIGGVIRLSNHTDFLALLAGLPSQAMVYPGTVPANPMFPYVLVRAFTPRVTDRSLNRTVHARVDRWRVTITGLSHDAVQIIDTQCRTALEGTRINSQRVEEIPNSIPIDEDLDVTLPSGLHPFYVVQEWRVMQ